MTALRAAQHVAEVRRVLGLGIVELAAYLRVAPDVVDQWERQARPIPDAILRDVTLLEQIGPDIRTLLPLSDWLSLSR